MWTVVYVAPNRPVAEMIKEMLENDGLLVMIRCAGIPHLGTQVSLKYWCRNRKWMRPRSL